MKSKLLSTFSMLRFFIVAALTVFCVSCDKTETTDSTGFILHYLGVTDIGPGMSYTLQAPTYKGSAPYDFTITKVTLNEETFSNNDNFVINAETGEITIQNTDGMTSGMYSISVGCYSNGKFFDFKDAVQVNMLLAVPEGVTVEPAEVLVNQDEENWAEASAQVSTEADKHVSITGYAIAQDETKPYLSYFTFDPNTKGKIIIRESEKDKLVAGESYTLNLKLTTKAGEHMYNNAVTFKVVSKPRDLFYIETEALPDLFETGTENKSVIPTIAGAKEELKFAIKSVTPETTAFTINETTGQISVPEGNSLEISETPYVFTITASNAYGSNDFEGIYSVKVVAFIEPIQPETFKYTAINQLYQLGGKAEDNAIVPGFVGGAPTFTFDANNSDEIKAQIDQKFITLNSANGTIDITDKQTLSTGKHEIKVRVTNKKNEEGVVSALEVNVIPNPNNFEYVSWGTNIENEIPTNTNGNKTNPISTETTEETKEENRNLFRFIQGRDVRELPLQRIKMINENANTTSTYKVLENNFIGHEKIVKGAKVKEDGTIYFTNLTAKKNFADGSSNAKGCVFQIAVTAKGNNAPAVTKNIPIFISTPKPTVIRYPNIVDKDKINYVLLCTPFVIKVNPKEPKIPSIKTQMHIIGAQDIDGVQTNYSLYSGILDDYHSNFIWDYRDDFSYCNFDDNTGHGTGDNKSAGNLLNQIWSNIGVATTTNTPFRYYDHKTGQIDKQNTKAAYIEPTSNGHQLIINPNVWQAADGKYPYGAMLGNMRFTLENKPENLEAGTLCASQYSFIIWFDETYEGN